MSKFRNWALRKLRGRTEEDYEDLYQVHCEDKLEIAKLKMKYRTMRIEPIRSELRFNTLMMNIGGEELKEYVKNKFAEDLGHYMIDNGFVSLSSHPDGADALVYVMNTQAVKIEGGLPDESYRCCAQNRRFR